MDYIYSLRKNWGVSLWGFIHSITINSHPKNISNVAEDNENHYKHSLEETIKRNTRIIEILKNIKDIIPCPRCIETYSSHLEYLNNIDLSEQMVLFKWSVDCHNSVNIKLNKPIITYEHALEMWTTRDYYYREFNK